MTELARKHERIFFNKSITYTVYVVDFKLLKKVKNIGTSTDVSFGGLGMITDYPLKKGHVLTFLDTFELHNITSKKNAIVKWSKKIEDKYRIGLMFV